MTNKGESTPGILKKTRYASLPAMLLVLNVLLFGTFAVSAENPGEFLVPYSAVLASFAPLGLILLAGIILAVLLLDKHTGHMLNAGLILLGVLTYIHGSLLLWDTGILDGRALQFSETWRSVVDGMLWLILAAAALRYRHWLVEHGWKICTTLILFQSIGVLAGIANRPDDAGGNIFAFPPQLADFSDRGNVIHLVLDGFQGSIFEELVSADSDIRDELSGFTFFRDVTTASDVTYLSVPATLSGKVFSNETSISEYHEETLGGENLYSFLAKNDYSVDVVTPLWWNKSSELFSSYLRIPKPYAGEAEALKSTSLLFADVSLFRQVPYFLKPLVYNDGTWLLSGSLVSEPEQQFAQFAHSAFLTDLQERMRVEAGSPRYKFLHLISPHAPFVTHSDCSFSGGELAYDNMAFTTQSRCTLDTLTGFLDRLKLLGLYDEALLVIHGDHGGGVAFNMIRADGSEAPSSEVLHRMWGNPLPLLMVKPPGATGPLETSNRLVQLTDVPATLADLLGLDNPFPGQSMFAADGSVTPDRFYYRSTMHRNDAAAKDSFDNFSRFLISGSIYQEESWSEEETYLAPVADDEGVYVWGTALTFGNTGTFKPFQSGGWIVTTSRDVTWTEGNEAGLSITFGEVEHPVKMKAKIKPLLAPGTLDQQRVTIYFGGEIAAEWAVLKNHFHDVELTIPATLFSETGPTEIRFELPDAQSPAELRIGRDTRALGLAFMTVQFDIMATEEVGD